MEGKGKPLATKTIAKNKKAYFDYEILEKYVTGIVLTGAEVKAIKGGHVQMKGSFAVIDRGRVMVENMHVSPYQYSIAAGYDPLRRRELLLRKKEIEYLAGQSSQKGFTLVPLEIFLKKGLIKVLLGICRGKQAHDKRQVLKGRAMEREIAQGLKKFTH
ncbi:MAG: SsrA-binding protein SmpB [Patescibacteria group bacterium]